MEGIEGSRPAAGARAFKLRLRLNYQFLPCINSRRVSAGGRPRVGGRVCGRTGERVGERLGAWVHVWVWVGGCGWVWVGGCGWVGVWVVGVDVDVGGWVWV